MVDFELGLINATAEVFGRDLQIIACFFHLCQSAFRHVQSVGLQREYNDANDATIRDAVRQMCALAFVPIHDVIRVFELFKQSAPRGRFSQIVEYFEVSLKKKKFERFIIFVSYFKETYVRGQRLRGRNRWSGPRYSITLWNHYDSVVNEESRTNNASEGWHTRFISMVGMVHPPFYRFLVSLRKEQNSTEGLFQRMDLGQPVRRAPPTACRTREDRIKNIVERYDEFRGRELQYLDRLSHYVHI